MSKEYSLAIVLFLGGVLKLFGIEIENSILEGLIVGIVALVIAIARKSRGDIGILGFRK